MSQKEFVYRSKRPAALWGSTRSVRLLASLCLISGATVVLSQGVKAEEMNPPLRMEKSRSDIKTHGAMKDEIYGLKPQIGAMVFKPIENGVTQDTESRVMAGATFDVNLFRLASEDLRNFFGGVSVGALVSHVGTPGANAFGAGDNGGGGNLLLIPLNLKFGYNVNEAFRISLHGGANWVYRSIGNQFNFGAQGAGSGDDWTPYPNVGMDFEFGKSVAFMFRPDFTITPQDEIFTGTLALSIPLG
jgi:hypothetical protein